MQYEWSAAKNERNIRERQLDFARAVRMFDGPVLQWTRLPQQYPERRVMAVGLVDGVGLTVVYAQLAPLRRRIISARRATRKEPRLYEKAFPPSPAP
jgi:uncharacterized protein